MSWMSSHWIAWMSGGNGKVGSFKLSEREGWKGNGWTIF